VPSTGNTSLQTQGDAYGWQTSKYLAFFTKGVAKIAMAKRTCSPCVAVKPLCGAPDTRHDDRVNFGATIGRRSDERIDETEAFNPTSALSI